ncbi:MAG: polyamine ABC transporter ATP-binding protein [Deltaproteobacteria bacterium]|nr:polyamine ABC transporter ATP-binding protein [Deltaproteobacteria bacterium]
MSQPETLPESTTDETSEAYIQIRGVTKKFDAITAVDNVDLNIQNGEIFALLGASGCGKTTLLRLLAGFDIATDGQITIDGENMQSIQPYNRPVNMMFQSYALFPHMSVAKNIAFGLKQDRIPKAEIKSRVKELLELVHMGTFSDRFPHQLSGGQRQRVALARSLAKRPKLLLLDEPMAALDKKLREQMQLEVVNIIERVGVTCVMVTHDQEEAMTMATRIGVMHEGKILQTGTPHDVYEHPNCRRTAEFIGTVNIFKGTVIENSADHVLIDAPEFPRGIYIDHGISASKGSIVWVAIRPEKMIINTAPPSGKYNHARGKVEEIAYIGGLSIYHVKTQSGKVIRAVLANVDRLAESRPTWDDEVYLSWQAGVAEVLTW